MIDAPASIYVEYKNLSSFLSQAEFQKDILISVVRKLEGQGKTILEFKNDESINKMGIDAPYYLQIKCIECYKILENNTSLVLDSVKKYSRGRSESSVILFDTTELSGKVMTWKIEVSEMKPTLVRANQNVRIQYQYGPGITIQSFGKALKDGAHGDNIRVQVNHFFEKKGSPNSYELIDALVTAPNEVEYASK